MHTRLLILSLSLLLTALVSAQNKRPGVSDAFFSKVGVGGNLGLRFGNITYVEVSPVAGYRLSPLLMPGIGVTYRYIRFRYPGMPAVGTNIYGASAWLRIYVGDRFFGYGEYEVLNGAWDPYNRPLNRYNIFTPFVGGGYSQGFGGASSYILVLMSLNTDPDSPYLNPVIRVGFMFGGTGE